MFRLRPYHVAAWIAALAALPPFPAGAEPAGGLAGGLAPLSAGYAAPGRLGEIERIFASCAGRLSAEIEQGWLMGRDTRADEAARAGLEEILAATLPSGAGPAARALRIEAKAAQGALLQEAEFGQHGAQARLRARALANRLGAPCRALVLRPLSPP